MGAKLKKHLAWMLSISLILGSGGFGRIGDIISWAEVGVKEQGIVASDSQAYEKTEIEGPEKGADEEARTDVDETGAEAETSEGDKTNEDEAGRDETGGDGTDKGEISKDEELHPYGYATKSDASVQPDHPVSEDKGDSIDGDFSETDIDVADLIDAEEDTYGYEHVTPDGIKILIKVTASDWPEDTQIQVVKVTGQEQERVTGLVEDALEKEAVSMVYAYDISFQSKGEIFEPEGEIEVTFQFPEEEKERFKGKTEIFHIKDEEDHVDIMQKESETEMEVSCLADGFSVYGVAVTAAGPIAIYTAEELRDIYGRSSYDYILMNDIDLSGWGEWEPIPYIWGNFDGNGHTISNLRLEKQNQKLGLFEYIEGSVKNLTIQNATIEVSTFGAAIGILAGVNEGQISSCKVSGNIDIIMDGAGCIGGIIGDNSGNISDCQCDVSITVDGRRSGPVVGGIVGSSGGLVERSINRGNINANFISDEICVGGIAGGAISVKQCANYGELNVNIALEGKQFAVTARAEIGGIQGKTINSLGLLEVGEVVDCYNTGNITANASVINSGPAGFAHATLRVGGILGEVYDYTKICCNKVENCYNIGQITCDATTSSTSGRNEESLQIGNITGHHENITKSKDCYYIQSEYDGIGWFTDEDVPDPYVALTNTQMQRRDSFVGFDFASIWRMGEGDYPYPIFQWQDLGPDTPSIPDTPEEDGSPLMIKDCSPWQDEKLYWDSDIRIEFNKEIYGVPGEGCDQKFEIREYVADTTMFEWDPSYSDYSIEGNVLTLHNALVGCREQTGLMYYLYIPDGFFKSAADPSELLTGYEEKGRFTFVLSYPEFPDLHFVQFKYKKDGEMILYYYQAVDDGKTCIAPNGPVWEGHRFVDWYVDEDLKTVFDFTTPIHRNYILYAKYIDDPNVPSGSVSGGGNKSKHEHNDIFNSTARDSGFVEVKDPKTGTVLWKCYQNGEPVTGYVQNFYYNGVPGSFLFDENGIMLTGWHRVNGQLRYFDETPGHRGYEITARDMADRVTKNSAYKYLGSYTFASTFANDLDMLDATAFLIVNYSDVEKLVKKWILTGQDQVAANEDWARIYLKQIIDSLCDTQNPGPYFAINDAEKQGSREASKILTDLVKTTEFSSVAEMYEYMKKATDYSEDILDKMFANYTSNICMLDSYARICPEMRSVIEELKAGYTHSVRLNLRKSVIDKMVDEFDVKNIAKGYNELKGSSASDGALTMGYSASDAVVNKMIAKLFVQTLQEGVKSSTSVSRVENVIYSAYTRTQAINALRRAEQSLQVNPDREDALNDYVVAFNIAKEATRIQYWNIFEYYNMKGETEKASKAYEGYRKLSGDSFYSY